MRLTHLLDGYRLLTCTCLSLHRKDYDMAKEWAKAFYASGPWQRVREYVLRRDRFMCQRCKRPADTVHHKVRLTPDNIHDPMISLNPDNLEAICDDCHKAEHDEERKKAFIMNPETIMKREQIELDYRFDSNGNIVPRSPRGC